MRKLKGEVLTLPKMSGSVSAPKSLSGNVGAKTINIGGKGDDGATFTPSVSADGIISWTNDKDLPNPEPVNIKGAKGDKGDKGDRGLQGIQGIQGERGEQGQKGDKGDRGEQGIQGVQGAKGETGAQGQKGADGTPATHRWSGTTLYITSASGTSSANLKGEKGETGPQGPAGADGAPGKDGKDGTNGKDGADGFSPSVAVSDIDGGHRVTITDKDGEKAFDVMDGAGGSGGTVHWDDVQGKPVVSVGGSDTLTWDGNTEGLLAVEVPVLGNTFYKVADTVLTQKDVWGEDNSRYEIARVDWGDDFSFTVGNNDELTAMTDDIMRQCTDGEQGHYPGAPIVFYIDKAICTMVDNFQLGDVVFPEAGVYFAADTRSLYILDFKRFNSVEHIDMNYLPEALQFGEEVVTTVEPLNIQWDGNTEGMTVVQSLVAPELVWAKVSDEVFTDEQIKVMDYAFGALDDDNTAPTAETWETTVNTGSVTNDFVVVQSFVDPLIVFIRKAGVTFGGEADILSGATFPEVGVYFFRPDQFVFAKYLGGNIPYTKTIVHTVEPKYLPMSDITAAVLSALPIYNGEVEEV